MKMKKTRFGILFLVAALAAGSGYADKLVMLHTNDTHSQIDPGDLDGLGGVVRRQALVDSVRAVNDNVLLIDAGDVVQGTLYFNLYGGEVENKIADALGYDYRILGNHEFDNGTAELAKHIAGTKSQWLATNYDLTGSGLEQKFAPYSIRQIGDRRIGFIGLNLNPEGMIAPGNYDGVEYLGMYKAANATAWHLKHNEKVDMVVAITHVGYEPSETGTSDVELAQRSEDIDIIIGGHSHTTIDKPLRIDNGAGRPVLVTQTGKAGRNLGEITVELDDLTSDYKLIPVTASADQLVSADARCDTLRMIIEPYRAGVDSLMRVPVARSTKALTKKGNALVNFVTDYIKVRGDELAPGVDLALNNTGGIRRDLPKGTITEGQILTTLPFNNRVTVIELDGADLLANFDIMATGSGAVSDGVEVILDPETNKTVSATINGKPVEAGKTYRVATIDYLANGGDYMTPLTRGRVVATSDRKLSDDMLTWLRKEHRKKPINPSDAKRMHK